MSAFAARQGRIEKTGNEGIDSQDSSSLANIISSDTISTLTFDTDVGAQSEMTVESEPASVGLTPINNNDYGDDLDEGPDDM